MAERKLNLNAPLMSVRRTASRPVSPIRTPPTEQVTEPVAVPFHWEQIPGLAKERSKVEPKKKLAPRTPPGKKVEPNKKKNRREEEEEDEDAYSDALDTMCSLSQESGSDGGGFSTDPHTRDFMMNRFLPAAKAMAFTYTPKKQSPKPAPKQVVIKTLSLPPNGVSKIQTQQEQEREGESESESGSEDGEDRNGPQVVTERGCGLFPRLCFRNSLSLLGPLPALKLSSSKPNSAYNHSISKSVKKAWDTHMKRLESGSKPREEKKKKNGDESKRLAFSGEIIGRLSPFRSSRSRSGELHKIDNKGGEILGGLSPFRSSRSRSGELHKVDNKGGDIIRGLSPFQSSRSRSGELHKVDNKGSEIIGGLSPFRSSRSRSGELHMFDKKGRDVEPKRFAYSGELNRGTLSPFRSARGPAENLKADLGSRLAELKMAENKRANDPRRLAYSSDVQRVSSSLSSSPFRPTPRAASISPYRNQSPQSPFRRGAFLGLPNEENAKAANKFSGSRRSFSPIPAIEKTLYVDNADRGSGYLHNKPRFHSGEQLRGARWTEEEFSFQDLKSLNNAMALEILEQEMCVPRKSKHRQEVKTSSEKLNAKADTDNGLNSSSEKSPLHPPLPRSPSESWLWRTISMRNSFGLKAEARDLEPKISSTNITKWETIVKTSKSHHDHARYSQELVAHISKQS